MAIAPEIHYVRCWCCDSDFRQACTGKLAAVSCPDCEVTCIVSNILVRTSRFGSHVKNIHSWQRTSR